MSNRFKQTPAMESGSAQTDKQIKNKQTTKQTNTQTNKETNKQPNKQTNTQTNSTNKQIFSAWTSLFASFG